MAPDVALSSPAWRSNAAMDSRQRGNRGDDRRRLVTADHAMVLTALAANNTGTQAAVSAEIAALVPGLTTAAHAIDVLAHLGAGAAQTTQTAICEEISALVAAAKRINSGIDPDQACTTLCQLSKSGAPAFQAFAGEAIAALVAHGLITASRAVQDVAAQLQPNTAAYWTVMVSMMAETAPGLKDAAANLTSNAFRSYPGSVVAMGMIDAAVTAHALTGAQAATALGAMAVSFSNGISENLPQGGWNQNYNRDSNVALNAIGMELNNLVAHHEVTATQAMLR